MHARKDAATGWDTDLAMLGYPFTLIREIHEDEISGNRFYKIEKKGDKR